MEKLVQQDAPELERRLTELQSQINRMSLSLHLWQERQDRVLEQRLTDWSALEARTQKDASARMRELQETIEHEWNELRQVQEDPNQYIKELGLTLGQKLSDLTEQVQAVVAELRASGPTRNQSLQPASSNWALDDVVKLHNQLRQEGQVQGAGEQPFPMRPALALPEAPSAITERLEMLERAVSDTHVDGSRTISPIWRVAIILLAVGLGTAGILVTRLQRQMTAATERVSQAEQQAQVATKTATQQIAAAREEASQQIAQARDAAEKAQTISDVLAAPDLVRYNLVGGDGTTSFNAQVLVSRSHGLVFSQSRLPPLSKDSTYQIWLLSGGGAASVGTFVPDADGRYSMATATLPRIPPPIAGVQVTLERAGGSVAPSGRVVLSRAVQPPSALEVTPTPGAP